MSGNHNPILDSDWKLIWAHNEGEAIKKVKSAIASSQVKVLILALLLTGFFIWARRYMFIYSWVGLGIGFFMLFWLLFLNPAKKLPGRMEMALEPYVQEIIFENPKNPSVFLKHHWEHQKYEWGALLFFWCVGVNLCAYWENSYWMMMVPHQGELINKLPSFIPIAVLSNVIVCLVFSVFMGQAKPKTSTGKAKKVLFLIMLGAILLATLWIAAIHSYVVGKFFFNWEDYSIRYPRELTETYGAWPFDEFFFNWNLFFWIIGIILSMIIAGFFTVCCDTYINLNIRKAIKQVHQQVLEQKVEGLWETPTIAKRHDWEEKLKLKIRIISGVELGVFFTLVLVALWGFYYYWGEAVENDTMMYLGIGIMALQLIWAIFLSPIYHYHLEKPLYYRQKHQTLGYVGLDDRGIGSWRLYWRKNMKNPRDKKILVIVDLFTILVLTGTVMKERSVLEFFEESLSIPQYQTLAVMSTLYAMAAVALLIFVIKVADFPDPKDSERGKKRLFSLILIGFIIGLNFAIAGIFHDLGSEIGRYYSAFSGDRVLAMLIMVVVLGLIIFIWNLLVLPFFLRFEDLYESVPDLLTIVVSGIIVLVTWNYLSEIFMDMGSGLTHFSWRDDDPRLLREEFHWGHFLSNVGTYHYWGWVQELLFLGYFCWLSWKAFPNNKWANAAISSALFCLFHWPNLPLMIATAIGGFLWAIWWGERRNLFMMGIMHGFNGSLVDYLVPMSMSVGPGVL